MSAPGAFTGFGPDLSAFYEGLAADNSRAYFQAHRSTYDDQVRGPLEALAADLEEEFGAAKVFRPQRDVRFSADKRPYADHASLAVSGPGGTALYLSVNADQLLLAGGMYTAAPDQLARFRRAVDAGPAAVELDRIVAAAEERAGLLLSDGDPVKTAPRGWARTTPGSTCCDGAA